MGSAGAGNDLTPPECWATISAKVIGISRRVRMAFPVNGRPNK